MEPGTYYVQAIPYSGYSAAYYAQGASGVESWTSADSIVVPGSVANVSIGVVPITSTGVVTMSGTVKLSDGTPIQGAGVTARTTDGTVVGFAMTDGDGLYAIDAVAQGEVSVSADRIGVKEGAQTVTSQSDVYEVSGVDFLLDVVVGVPGDDGLPIGDGNWRRERRFDIVSRFLAASATPDPIERSFDMSVLVGRTAPDFTAPAVYPNGSIKDLKLSGLKGKHVCLFFWPLDFTFVCPTEIVAHDHRLTQFKERGVEIVGVSIDSQSTHYAWRETPLEKGGIGKVGFPIVADVKHAISQAYGVEHSPGSSWRRSTTNTDPGSVLA